MNSEQELRRILGNVQRNNNPSSYSRGFRLKRAIPFLFGLAAVVGIVYVMGKKPAMAEGYNLVDQKIVNNVQVMQDSTDTTSSKKHHHKITYKTNDFSTDSDTVLLARLLFGETRGELKTDGVAVAYTAISRARDDDPSNGNTLREAILADYQYSTFNKNDPNYEKVKNPEKYDVTSWNECLNLAQGILSGKYSDPTNGATNYYLLEGMSKDRNGNRKEPSWAKSDRLAKVGKIRTKSGLTKHLYFRPISDR
jgi:N-acetylmuramoyl-L-alanine amidase